MIRAPSKSLGLKNNLLIWIKYLSILLGWHVLHGIISQEIVLFKLKPCPPFVLRNCTTYEYTHVELN
jgi:hypothetical protein